MGATGLRVTPIRKQYLNIKRQYTNAILFFRLGDFYETFDEDAETTARELDIVLTSRSVSKGIPIPMAGIPCHAAENYLARLVNKGYHVAICEQIGKEPINGLMPRAVVRVVTPGTVVAPGMLQSGRNNYLAAVVMEGSESGFAFVDITTGEFRAAQFEESEEKQGIRDEISRVAPVELLVPENMSDSLQVSATTNLSLLPDWKFEKSACYQALCDHFEVSTMDGFGVGEQPLAIRAAGAIINYLKVTEAAALKLLTGLATYADDEFMQLDAVSRQNLELTQTIRYGQVRGSLLGVLNCTVTSMGGRLLRQWINQPLLEVEAINERLKGVAVIHADGMLRGGLREALKPLGDLERLVNRVMGGLAGPNDLGAIRAVLKGLPKVMRLIEDHDAVGERSVLQSVAESIELAPELVSMLERAIVDEPPAKLDKPGTIRSGWSSELDEVVTASRDAREWIAGLEGVERKRSGIKTLKVRYNKIFGYFIEVTKANTGQVPQDYIRKQTLVNAERYITPELKEYETLVLNADEEIVVIERRMFSEVCAHVTTMANRLLRTSQAIARLDVLTALAECAAKYNYVRPQVVEEDVLQITGCRHSVVERTMTPGERFVPNDCCFLPKERVWVITGPNMSGKSTFLRQVALCVLMAQIGSFVPAESACIGVVDRIFTRIGAHDEIHSGQSTFMVEMVEAANILRNATPRSLLILDEIGRGTSTYDGLSLAWGIIEHLHNHPRLGAKTLFATHFHELTDLADILTGVSNYNVSVSEDGEEIIFLHRLAHGAADRSYGIHVARLAGLPRAVVCRAEEILSALESSGGRVTRGSKRDHERSLLADTSPLMKELDKLDINKLSPLGALNKIHEWQRRFLVREN